MYKSTQLKKVNECKKVVELKTYTNVKNTVKPLYSEHHRDLKIVSVIERCPLHGGSS